MATPVARHALSTCLAILAVASAGCTTPSSQAPFADTLAGGSGFATSVWLDRPVIGDSKPVNFAMASNESVFAVLLENGSVLLATRAGLLLAAWSWPSFPGYSSPGTPPPDIGCPLPRELQFSGNHLLISCERFVRAYTLDGSPLWELERPGPVVALAAVGDTGRILIGIARTGAELFDLPSNQSVPLAASAVVESAASAADGSVLAVSGSGGDLQSGSTCFFNATGGRLGCVDAMGRVIVATDGSSAMVGPLDPDRRSVLTVDLRARPLTSSTVTLQGWVPGAYDLTASRDPFFASPHLTFFGVPTCILLYSLRQGQSETMTSCALAASTYRVGSAQGGLGFTTNGSLFVAGFAREDGSALAFSYAGGWDAQGAYVNRIYLTEAQPGATLPHAERHGP